MMRVTKTYSLGELSIHHEVVNVFLRSSQLQFPRDDGHQESRTSRSLIYEAALERKNIF